MTKLHIKKEQIWQAIEDHIFLLLFVIVGMCIITLISIFFMGSLHKSRSDYIILIVAIVSGVIDMALILIGYICVKSPYYSAFLKCDLFVAYHRALEKSSLNPDKGEGRASK